MLTFDKEYFNEEEREGFVVSSEMKRLWAAQLEVISHISAICDKYGIQYFAYWGTLLGAVRHKGYIPWDDDFDIIMKRKDYERFITVAQFELPEGYVIKTVYKDVTWDEQLARVCNAKQVNCTKEFLEENHGCPYVAGVDIFPYDYIPNDEGKRRLQEELYDKATKAWATSTELMQALRNKNDSEIRRLEAVFIPMIAELESYFGIEFSRNEQVENQLLCLTDQIASSYGDEGDEYLTFFSEKYLRGLRGRDYKIPAYWLDKAIDLPFENITVKVPKFYELCLTACYGNRYMIPVMNGGGHEYQYFSKQVEPLKRAGIYDKFMAEVDKYIEEETDNRLKNITSVKANSISINENATNFSKDETESELRALITEWRSPNKKVILCSFGIMDFYENEEACIDKLEDTLTFFEGSAEKICMILLETKGVLEILARKDMALANRYSEIINKTKESDWCLVIDPFQYESVVDMCDAYYGSSNEYIKHFQVNKKPIMIQNINITNMK